jgi:hydrophobe/amphiphile efflux-1 (HAE1) family protein
MSLASISISRPVFAWMLTAAVFLFGGMAFSKIGISLFPDVDFPYVTVSVDYPGASPELVESDITETVEGALSGVEGVRSMSSSSRYGSARVSLEFGIDKNIDVALQEVQSAMQTAMRLLPDGIEMPTIRKTNPEDQPIMWVALSGPYEKRDLMLFARNSVKDRFTSIEGVSDVLLGGYIDPAIRIWVDPKKLENLELTHSDIIATLQSEHVELPAGRITREKDEINLRFQGEAPDIETLKNIPISRRSGQTLFRQIKLRDVAKVEVGLEDVRRFARSGGKEAIGLGILKIRGVNSVAVADRVMQTMNSIELPEGFQLAINFDSTRAIRTSIRELVFTLCLSVALTALVCWLFLGSLTSTFNILIAIPTSLLGTFLALSYLGYTLNTFTMLALILGVGIIVDDAIMVLENIFRHRGFQKTTSLAALKGTEQVQFAALATTLAVIAIFIPIIYVDGMIGAYLAQFAITLSIAVAFSTFEALTFTPMRLANFKGSGAPRGIPKYFGAIIDKGSSLYTNTIAKLHKHPFKIYGVVLVVFALSASLVMSIPKELQPDDDQGALRARAELPLGTSLEETGRRLEAVEKIILEQEGVERAYSIIGGFGGGTVNTAVLFITLTDKRDRRLSHIEIQNELRGKLNSLGDGLTVRIQGAGARGIGGRRGYPVELNLKGPDWDLLVKTSRQLEEALEADPMFIDVDSSFEDGAPELQVFPNRQAALARSVPLRSISETLSFVYQGLKPARYNDDGRRVNIIVQADPSKSPQEADDFKNIYVRNNRGQLISLSELVEVRKGESALSISREDRERNIEVFANIATGYSQQQALQRADALFKELNEDRIRIDRDARGGFGDTFRNLIFALILGLVVAYMVLASQFNSYLDPLIILLAVPFSFGGAFISLKLTGTSLNLFSMIGLLLLMGIVKKNSIMLVEFANQELRAQTGVKDACAAMIEACRTRFRPIVMTAFTTVAAASPPAFKIGIDSSATSSMAVGIIGGLLLSTALTLFVVPTVYIQVKSWVLKRQTH